MGARRFSGGTHVQHVDLAFGGGVGCLDEVMDVDEAWMQKLLAIKTPLRALQIRWKLLLPLERKDLQMNRSKFRR